MGSIYMYENDTGPDDANHAEYGIFVFAPGAGRTVAPKDDYSIYDIAPTILKYFDVTVPEDMIGTSIL